MHIVPTCAQTVGRQVAPVQDAVELVMEVSQLVQFSLKRLTLFQSMQFEVPSSNPSLKPLCLTHWMVWTSAIQSIVRNYAVLCDTLYKVNEEGRNNYTTKVGGILCVMEKFSTYFGLQLSHLIFFCIGAAVPHAVSKGRTLPYKQLYKL